MSSKKYDNAGSFRNALLDKLKVGSVNTLEIQNKQRQVAFERFLCRLFYHSELLWALKGGHALELRIQDSRATKDLDLALKDARIFDASSPKEQNIVILELLQEKARIDLGDFFDFNVLPPVLDLDAPPYGGGRFPVECNIGGKRFVRFNIDIAVGDVWIEPHDKIQLGNFLAFAGIDSQLIPVISVEQHFAEKIHAYSLPRKSGYNSRVKDLVDMLLLIKEDLVDVNKLKHAVEETFQRRKTHDIPKGLEVPPADWQAPFERMIRESNLDLSLNLAYKQLQDFWEKIFP